MRWEQASDLRRDVVELKATPGLDSGQTGWDSALDRVLDDASAQVASARGRAQVLLVGLLATAALTVVLAAQLLARRRAGPLTLARERGATLVGIGAELAVESALVAVAGAAVGVGVTAALLGSAGGRWVLPVVVVAVLAAPVLGTVEAGPGHECPSGARQPRRSTRRRTTATGRGAWCWRRRLVGLAVLTFVALQQRGPVAGDLAPASTPTVWALVGALVLVRVLPPLVRRVLRRTGRSAGRLPFFVAARVAAGGLRALPLVVVVVAVAQLVFGSTLAATQQRGQESGALLAVGGDARLRSVPAREVADRAAEVGRGARRTRRGRRPGRRRDARVLGVHGRIGAPGGRRRPRLRAAAGRERPARRAPARAADGHRRRGRAGAGPAARRPVGSRERAARCAGADDDLALDVVGEAPRVDAATDPVVVVDAAAFAAAGAVADPDTIWAVGPGAPEALRAAAEEDPADTVLTYDEVLTRLRDAPLPAALVHLAVAASLLLVLLAGLGVVLGAAVDAPARATALGRLRSLGLADRELRRVLAGELLVPVLASVLTGLVVGVATAWATFGSLGLEEVTGQSETPQLVVPLWTWTGRPRAAAGGAGAGGAPEQPAPAHQPGAAAAQRRLPLARHTRSCSPRPPRRRGR